MLRGCSSTSSSSPTMAPLNKFDVVVDVDVDVDFGDGNGDGLGHGCGDGEYFGPG